MWAARPTAESPGLVLPDACIDVIWDGADLFVAGPDTGPVPGEVHALSEVFVFLEQAPDRERAARAATRAHERLARAEMFLADPEATGYGLTPLTIAPQAGSRWRELFPAEQIEAHLDRLLRDQETDGGWPITWDPPSAAARLEWRGMVTLTAIRTLVSYGRVDPAV